MNTKAAASKTSLLASLGYAIKTLDNGTVIATLGETTIQLSDSTMEVRTHNAYHKHEGWKQFDLSSFMVFMHSMKLIPLSSEDMAQEAMTLQQYETDLANALSTTSTI